MPKELPKDNYRDRVKDLISQLNTTHSNKSKIKIIEKLKELDKKFLSNLSVDIEGKILLSRHGECNSFEQKKWGFCPNAALSDDALENMKNTNKHTHSFLLFSNQNPTIKISPMVRPLQTATKLIPKDCQANLTIHPVLSENSDYPSGLDLRSSEDLKLESRKISFFSSPLKWIIFKLSAWWHHADYFDDLKNKTTNALQEINSHQSDEAIQHPQEINYSKNKIKKINKLIDKHSNHADLWLIGHGKNFKAFFSKTFNIDKSFSFCETRTMYRCLNRETTVYFTPYYSFLINQNSGKIEGKFIENGCRFQRTKPLLNLLENMNSSVEDTSFTAPFTNLI